MKNLHTTPPRLFLRFFRWYCRPRLQDYIEGDLMEVYGRWMKKYGKRKADGLFAIEVLRLCRPGIIGPVGRPNHTNHYTMFRSYFKTGWRNLLKHKGYSFINIGGLAIGMGVAMLIGLWIHDQLEFNRNHENYDRIARVMRNGTLNGEIHTYSYLPYALGNELQSQYGTVFKHVVMAWPVGDHILSAGVRQMSVPGEFIQAEGAGMFSLKMLQGSWSALNDPHSVLLSESAAGALFGADHAIGKLLKIDNSMEVKVAGIYEDLPHNSHFHQVSFFAPWDLLVAANGWIKGQGFENNFLNIYVELEDHAEMEVASGLIRDAILDNIRENRDYFALNPQLFLHPMRKWHLWSEWKNGVNTGGLIQTVRFFGMIGVFVLLLACINFMNLSTARSERRAREVGIRKAVGSARAQLVHQFFSESFLVVLLAFGVALFLVTGSLEWFNHLAGKQIEMPWTHAGFWIGSLVFIVWTGLLAGSYPAFYLSSFHPVRVLKGSLHVGRWSSLPRKVLVVLQFTVSVTLIIGTIGVYEQIQYAKNRPVGYDRNGLLMVQMTSPDFRGKYELLQTELKNTRMVTEIAESSSPLTDIWNSNGGFNWQGKDPDFIPEFGTFTVTPEYGKTVGWTLVEGRDFVRQMVSDSSAFVINEAAAKVLGFQQPVGEVVQWQSWWTNGIKNFTIIGVIRDVVMKSPYAPPVPSVFFLGGNSNWLTIRIDPRVSTSEALSQIEAVFERILPSVPFDYQFADQEYALKFAAEERIGKLAGVFALLAIFISCLGLFGLASFMTEQRAREIGIRKVMGASALRLWTILSRDFVALVMLSCLIAIPLAHHFLTGWLMKFDYRTEPSWWVFASTCALALVITLMTVSYHAVKALLVNPVKSLRSE